MSTRYEELLSVKTREVAALRDEVDRLTRLRVQADFAMAGALRWFMSTGLGFIRGDRPAPELLAHTIEGQIKMLRNALGYGDTDSVVAVFMAVARGEMTADEAADELDRLKGR